MRRAHVLHRKGAWSGDAIDRVVLDYDARFLRRKVVAGESGASLLVDLEQATSLDDGDALEATDGALIVVQAAPEPLLEVRGDLARLAWHIGNRHTPCEISSDRLVIRQDPVLAKMLEGLGADLAKVRGPFRPEGGAYGHGRTMGHEHGHAHGHTHDHAGGHSHDHQHG